ncbi:ABC transporter permease [Nakamurella lactea]|uniref:ABC transporter permease n=1 Tax=Nakamurella lactea TaxID=459515 RepID=UPI0004041215|nr:ABC transporter permease [Nakamurella lactea]
MSTVELPAGGAAPIGLRRPRPVSSRFLRSELRLIFGRRRNIAGLAVLALVPIIIAVAVKVSAPRPGDGPDFFASITGNGLFVPLAALTVEITLFLPLAIAVIAGDSIAGEANLGTLRYLLTVPVNRTRLLAVKYAAITIFAVAATMLITVVGLVIGVALFHGGSMTLLSGNQIGFGGGLLRVLGATVYLAVQLAALGAIGLFLSSLTEQPIAAMAGLVVMTVVMYILDSIPQLGWLGPWLLTHRFTAFGDLLRSPVAWDTLRQGVICAASYALIFWLASWARFAGKDITS